MPIYLDGNTRWTVGRGGFLAMSDGVTKETKTQGLSKAMFSGEGLFVQQFTGRGVVFVTALGAIITRQLKANEQLIVDNGHLVAWTCPYAIERAGGSISAGMHSGEGLVCRFTGPGLIYIQVRNGSDNLIFYFFEIFRLETRKRCPNGSLLICIIILLNKSELTTIQQRKFKSFLCTTI